MSYTQEQLRKITQDGSAETVVLRSRCHPSAPFRALYTRGVLGLVCVACGEDTTFLALDPLWVGQSSQAPPEPNSERCNGCIVNPETDKREGVDCPVHGLRCGFCGEQGESLHQCPYAAEVNGDHGLCHCCEGCTDDCGDNI